MKLCIWCRNAVIMAELERCPACKWERLNELLDRRAYIASLPPSRERAIDLYITDALINATNENINERMFDRTFHNLMPASW